MMTLTAPTSIPTSTETRNTLLASLPGEEFAELAPLLQPAALVTGVRLHRAGEEARHVYFIERGLVSFLTTLADGTTIEVGLAGREGAVNVAAVLGRQPAAHHALVQMDGRALRMRADDAREAFRRHEEFRGCVLGYARALLTMSAQTAACNALHTIEERLARWLLLCWQRGGSDVLPLTHEMLSSMLGVRRSGVTVAAGALQRAGLIRYTRKDIVILDRARLEACACECFRSMSAALRRDAAG